MARVYKDAVIHHQIHVLERLFTTLMLLVFKITSNHLLVHRIFYCWGVISDSTCSVIHSLFWKIKKNFIIYSTEILYWLNSCWWDDYKLIAHNVPIFSLLMQLLFILSLKLCFCKLFLYILHPSLQIINLRN